MYWARIPPPAHARVVLRMLAYVNRYAPGLQGALQSDRVLLGVYLEELSRIVEEENRPRGGTGG